MTCASLTSTPARALLTIATITLTFTFTGCADDDGRGYALPKTLCGIPIDTNDLAPFLPAGREATVSEKDYSSSQWCDLIIDDAVVMSARQEWLSQGRTVAQYAAELAQEPLTHSVMGGRFHYSASEGFGKAEGCIGSKQELYTSIQVWSSDHQDADAMKHLVIDYTEEVEKSADCTG
ncbi:hypothetical protein [Streptomyces sp. NPDC057877]|uniref:hypothetical protein n=1 Tax=Streptomyces sp. NPDC057877 TaxID=3346269 RepID=UPI00368B8017